MAGERAPFRPSNHGCRFGNAATGGVPITAGPIRLGRVTGGLCGGMVLDSLRAWRRGGEPASTGGSDMTRVFAAQLRSFQVPSAPAAYFLLQRPRAQRLRRWVTERARNGAAASLQAHEPVPLALVCALSHSPRALTAHHVVLAYELVAHGDAGSAFAIYDPNHPGADDVTLRISPTGCEHSRGRQVHAVFALRAR